MTRYSSDKMSTYLVLEKTTPNVSEGIRISGFDEISVEKFEKKDFSTSYLAS